MTFFRFAAAASVVTGVCACGAGTVFAQPPLMGETPSLIVPVKDSAIEIEMKDFPFGLKEGVNKNVVLTLEQKLNIADPDDTGVLYYKSTLPSVKVEKDGADKVKLTLPDTYSIEIVTAGDGEDLIFEIDGISKNHVVEFERDGDVVSYTGIGDVFGLHMTSPRATGLDIEAELSIHGKNFAVNGTYAGSLFSNDIENLDVSYDYTLDDVKYDFRVVSEGEGQHIEGVGLASAIFARGLVGEGRIEGTTGGRDMSFDLVRPLPVNVSMGKLVTDTVMPIDASPDPQDIGFMIGMEDIQLDDFLWSVLDPKKELLRELNRFEIDIDMTAILTAALSDPEAIAEAEETGVPPFIPLGAKVNSIAFDGLGLALDAEGEVSMNGVQPEGDAYITLKGLSEFVESALKAGLLGQQQVILVQGMAGQLGKEGEDGELIFDIKTDAGMININDAPIFPIPGAVE